MFDDEPSEADLIESAERDRALRLKAANDIVDNFVRSDMLLTPDQLLREKDKFEQFLDGGELGRYVEACWTVFSSVAEEERTGFSGWLHDLAGEFDIESITASTKREAYLLRVVLHIREKSGKLYDYTQVYDMGEFLKIETFHDKKVELFRRFFNCRDMRNASTWADEVKMGYSDPYYVDMSKKPLGEQRAPRKIDPDEFKRIADQLEEESASGKSLKECADEGNKRCCWGRYKYVGGKLVDPTDRWRQA